VAVDNFIKGTDIEKLIEGESVVRPISCSHSYHHLFLYGLPQLCTNLKNMKY